MEIFHSCPDCAVSTTGTWANGMHWTLCPECYAAFREYDLGRINKLLRWCPDCNAPGLDAGHTGCPINPF